MNIRGAIYESLTPRQRITATMDAIEREDTTEVNRLKKTCPFKTYRQRDADYSETIEALFGAGLAMEADLRGEALGWWAHPDLKQREVRLGEMAAIITAWLTMLADMGITATAAVAPPMHPLVACLVEIAPEADSEKVAEYHALLKASIYA